MISSRRIPFIRNVCCVYNNILCFPARYTYFSNDVITPIPLQKPAHPAGHVYTRIDLLKLCQRHLKRSVIDNPSLCQIKAAQSPANGSTPGCSGPAPFYRPGCEPNKKTDEQKNRLTDQPIKYFLNRVPRLYPNPHFLCFSVLLFFCFPGFLFLPLNIRSGLLERLFLNNRVPAYSKVLYRRG
jgi:hypothetical protein